MTDTKHQPGELALVKAVRSLDQGKSETVPDKLDQIWKILSIYSGGKFHAAEEMIVRWLLKNMNGSSVEAEKLRRYPLTWRILSNVFSSIPLFSLAKSLADRRFVPILQNALKDASEPEKGTASSDTEMVDADRDDRPLKRKRSETVLYDLESQRQATGCLRTAEALFEALRLLLSRLESKTAKQENHMGAEHIKSLFCQTAEDIKGLVVPALSICDFAVNSTYLGESYDGQENWISTINGIWDLHLQVDGDSVQVATHFANPAINMLGRLIGVPHEWQLGVDSEVQSRWTQDIKRFLTRNLILPARTAFLNRELLEIIRIAVEKTMMFSTLSCPVIFDLVLSAPHLAGGQSAKRENDLWAQAVFSLLEEILQPSKSQYKLAAVQDMMDKALKWDVSLSRESLRSFARSYALESDTPQWSLLLLVGKLNPDAFIAEDDEKLLTAVLDASKSSDSLSGTDAGEAADFIITLADGFAKARDLTGFVKKWFQYLASVEPHTSAETPQYRLWYNEKLCKTIAEHLQKTMNTKQILSLLDWLDTQEDGPAQNSALVLILGALSQGVSQDDVVDAVGSRLHETVSRRSLPSSVNDEVLSNKWIVARRSIEWATYEQAQQIWKDLVAGVKKTLDKPLSRSSQLDAFKFVASTLVANHSGGVHEEDTSALLVKFADQVHAAQKGDRKASTVEPELLDQFIEFCASGCPRLLSLMLEKLGKQPSLSWITQSYLSSQASESVPDELAQHGDRAWNLIANENNTNSRKMADELRSACKLGLAPSLEGFLALPLEIFSREKREDVMGGELIPFAFGEVGEFNGSDPVMVKSVVSAMIKIMAKPTFYKDMEFGHLDRLGGIMAAGDKAIQLEYLPLLEELASRTLRQMTANIEKREQAYLRKAVSTVTTWPTSPADAHLIFRIVLAKRLVLAVNQPMVFKVLRDLDIETLKRQLGNMIKTVVQGFTAGPQDAESLKAGLPYLSAALEATCALKQDAVTKVLGAYKARLEDVSGKLAADGQVDVWTLRKFLVRINAAGSRVSIGKVLNPAGLQQGQNVMVNTEFAYKENMLECVDAVTEGISEDDKLHHVETLLLEPSNGSSQLVQLLAVQRIIQQLEGSRTMPSAAKKFDLAQAHTVLCGRLRHSKSPVEFLLITQILHTLVDDKWTSMTQWNIELTLSTVSTLSSQATTHPVVSTTPKSFESLCRLVQVIVRRHRLRLEGHFHILVTVLQSLLRHLISHPYTASNTTWASGLIKESSLIPHWEKHAKAFARLLTMICEPTAASVSRSHNQQNSLDSATDAAKRTAGQHMYLVLMLYIKLQLEQNVPHGVREAMEPGVFSVLDVTSPEGRRMMNDALDASGRAIMKEMYKQYLKFGKWSGI